MYKKFLLLFALLAPASFSVARADTNTYFVTVTSDSGANGSLDATYKLTFDPARIYRNQASGISVVSASGYFQPDPMLFSYDPTMGDGVLGIGALGSVYQIDDINDFYFSISEFTTDSPVFRDGFLFNGADADAVKTYGSVTEVAPTPEPSSLWMLGTGLLGGIPVLRRRMAL